MAGFFGVSVTVDTHVLDGLRPKVRPVTAALIKKHAVQFESIAKQRAPIDLGNLVNSIHIENLTELSATIQDGVEYGAYQEFGVNHPYTIDSPVNIKGNWVYIKTHPGFAPQPFFTPAAEAVGKSYFVEFFPIFLGGA